jgi:hypothetical protein
MITSLMLCLSLLAADPADLQVITEAQSAQKQKFIERATTKTANRNRTVSEKISQLNNELRKTKNRPGRKEIQAEIDKLESDMDSIQLPYLSTGWPTTGDVGVVPTGHVVQVINDYEMIVDIEDFLVWINGLSTMDLTKDRGVLLNRVFRVTGTRNHTTTGESKMILELRPIDVTGWFPEGAKLRY